MHPEEDEPTHPFVTDFTPERPGVIDIWADEYLEEGEHHDPLHQ